MKYTYPQKFFGKTFVGEYIYILISLSTLIVLATADIDITGIVIKGHAKKLIQ